MIQRQLYHQVHPITDGFGHTLNPKILHSLTTARWGEEGLCPKAVHSVNLFQAVQVLSTSLRLLSWFYLPINWSWPRVTLQAGFTV